MIRCTQIFILKELNISIRIKETPKIYNFTMQTLIEYGVSTPRTLIKAQQWGWEVKETFRIN